MLNGGKLQYIQRQVELEVERQLGATGCGRPAVPEHGHPLLEWAAALSSSLSHIGKGMSHRDESSNPKWNKEEIRECA